ncbi:L-lactate dehydrogenase [Klebsiella michiganensis]|nr:L-lactate dehydrogenase [Klebsiella michiganensis]
MTMDDYMGFISNNFDPSIAWHDLEWIRDSWKGKLIIKGILDPEDAKNAVRLGADGIVVSNHGGRQLDGAIPTARALPRVVDAIGDDLTVSGRFRSAFRGGRYPDACPWRKRGTAGTFIYLCAGDGRRSWVSHTCCACMLKI